jgi:hypothetical protein
MVSRLDKTGSIQGAQNWTWNGITGDGMMAEPGIYFVRILGSTTSETIKIVKQ